MTSPARIVSWISRVPGPLVDAIVGGLVVGAASATIVAPTARTAIFLGVTLVVFIGRAAHRRLAAELFEAVDPTPHAVFIENYNDSIRRGGPGVAWHEADKFLAALDAAGYEVRRKP